EFCIIEDLRALIEAVQAHPDAVLHRSGEPVKNDFISGEGVFDQNGKKIGDGRGATRVALRGCLIATADLSGLDITCTLMCRSRFAGFAWFENARFAGDAWFENARFAGDAWFENARFAGGAWFDDARFGGGAGFSGARFDGVAWFGDARFGGGAWFGGARFGGDAGFGGARFARGAGFGGARFGGGAWFGGARFRGDAGFGGTVFLTGAHFAEAIINAHAGVTGDARHIDARAIILESVYPAANTTQIPRLRDRVLAWAGALCRGLKTQRVPWTSVRAISEFSILSRISVLALILVPPIASAWPAIRAGIVGYNESVEDASRRFVDASESLRDAAAGLEGHERVGELVSGVERSIGAWSDRFGRMTIDSQDLPLSLAITFFAAALVTGGRFIYQMRAPDRIKQHSEEDFVEWMHTRYDDEAPDRDDGLRRACESLRAIAKQLPERHANFVQHHEETIWIPPKEHIEWFTDLELPPPEPDSEDSETQDLDSGEASERTQPEKSKTPRYPEGYLPAPERARIAIEEGATAEYLLRSRENPISALMCFIMYASAMVLLIWILAIQGLSVLRASGFIASEHVQTTDTVETRTPDPE
ncbi:MAG: pentapeptide repeat-containing protein, partial [Phycisphaerales bacterium]|nr:pentapeptide repeat-containing protein [Phycisphaerales bacterium]